MESTILWPVVLIYLAAMIAVGVWAARSRVTNYEDMTVAGRGVGPFLIGCSVAATYINGVTLITITGLGKSFGLSSYWLNGAVAVGVMWAGIFLVPRMWKLRVITTPQIFETFFGPSHRIVALVITLMRDFGATAGTIGSLALLTSQFLNIGILPALILTYVLTVVYVALGGMWAVMLTDAIQFFIIVAASIWLTGVCLARVGGFVGLVEQAEDPALFSLAGDFTALQIGGWISLGVFLSCGYQSLAQRAFSARSARAAQQGFLFGGIVISVWYIVPVLLGTAGVAIFGKDIDGDSVFIRLSRDVAGPYLGSLLFVSLLAANMSTLSSTIGTIGSNFTVDIFQRFIRPGADETTMLWVSRLSILITGIMAAVIYYVFPWLLELFFAGARVVAAALRIGSRRSLYRR